MVIDMDIAELIARVEAATGADNELDVAVELAIERALGATVRANAAGTKLIYTNPDGTEQTCRAWDWTQNEEARQTTLKRLRAIQNKEATDA